MYLHMMTILVLIFANLETIKESSLPCMVGYFLVWYFPAESVLCYHVNYEN